KLAVPGETSCDDLTIEEDKHWFDWSCVDTGGVVEFRTKALLFSLADLIDTKTPAWKENYFVVKRASSGQRVLETDLAPVWSNPVSAIDAVSSSKTRTLGTTGGVYVVRDSPTDRLHVTADRVSLIMLPEVDALKTTGQSNASLLDSTNVQWLMIEGLRLHADWQNAALDVHTTYGVLKDITVTRTRIGGVSSPCDVKIDGTRVQVSNLDTDDANWKAITFTGSELDVSDVRARWGPSDAITIAAQNSTFRRLHVHHVGGYGVRLLDASNDQLDDIQVSQALLDGVSLAGVSKSVLSDVFVTDDIENGVVMGASPNTAQPTRDVSLIGVVTSNNAKVGLWLDGRNNRAIEVIASSNDTDGVRVEGDNCVLMHATSALNAGIGVAVVSGAHDNLLANLVTANNVTGTYLQSGSVGTHVAHLFSTDNDDDLVVAGDSNLFTGTNELSSANACMIVGSPSSPGITLSPCAATGNTGTFSSPGAIAGALVGMLTTADSVNGAPVDVNGDILYDDIDDWENYSSHQRHWGVGGADLSSSAARGRCVSGETCGLWDLRVTAGPLADVNVPASFTPSKLTHVWSAVSSSQCVAGAVWNAGNVTCTTTFADRTFERADTGRGNHNGLCEAGELCTMARNRGGYQGEGVFETLSFSGTSGDYSLSGVGSFTVERYVDNSR
ncbi:MAG TPA: right-handed parallel beta-helix repeat-containing protein, partial [Polyangiales bacterium]|nr:right-handed parallel beta-helix repeat-containing protein [Polyangiales bacterium]